MKAIKTTLLITCLLISTSICYGTIFTADSNPGAVATATVLVGATALQDAIDAASDDDIIHVIRSTNSYGTVVVNKRLNIFGIGLFPDTDGAVRSTMSQMDIPDAIATGTRISGMVITTINLGAGTGALNNLLIENSQIRQVVHVANTTTLNNLLIRNCILGSNLSSGITIELLFGFVSNVVIANNVIYGNTSLVAPNNGALGSISTDQSTIENNLIAHGRASTQLFYAFQELRNSTVKNNIFYRMSPQGKAVLSQNSFENNLSFDTFSDIFSTASSNTSTNNLEGVDPQFVTVPNANNVGSLSTFDPSLIGGSPAEGTGTGTPPTDMGVYGGPIPFSLEGTLIPTIQELDVPSMVIEGNTLDVHIKAKGN